MASAGVISIGFVSKLSGLTRGIKDARGQLGGFGKDVGRLASTTTDAFARIGLAAAGVSAVTTGLKAVFGTPIKLAAQLEQTTVSFETLLGSASRAQSTLKELQEFGASTPFRFPEIAESAKKLIAFGVTTQELKGTLTSLGDVAAGLGIPFSQLSEIYGKIKVQGQVFAEDINQLQGRGIPITQELAKQFGVTQAEVKKLVSEGKVGFPEIEKAIKSMTSEGGKFQNMMKAQSKTMAGLWSTLKDNISLALTEIGKEIVTAFDLKAVTEGLIKFSQTFMGMIQPFFPLLTNFAKVLGVIALGFGILKAATLAYTMAMKALAIATAFWKALTSPTGLAAVAAGIAAAGIAALTLGKGIRGATTEMKAYQKEADKAKQASKKLGETTKKSSQIAVKAIDEEAERIARLRKLYFQLEEFRKENPNDLRFTVEKNDRIANIIKDATGVSATLDKTREQIKLLKGEITETDLVVESLKTKGALPQHLEEVRESLESLKVAKVGKELGAEIEEMRGEIDLLNGTATEFDLEIRKWAKQGATAELISDLRQVQEELKKAQEAAESKAQTKDFVDTLKEQTKTELDLFKERQAELQRASFLGMVDLDEGRKLDFQILPDFIKSALKDAEPPLEKFNNKIEELKELQKLGAIDQSEFDIVSDKLKKDILGAGGINGEVKFAGAAQLGSQEARNAILRNKFQQPNNEPMKNIEKESKKQTKSLNKIADNTGAILNESFAFDFG